MAETTKPPELWRSTLNIANLPEEILSEIFLLLPPKSVLLSRAVCKAWRRITSDRTFLISHHRRQPQRRLFTFVRDVGTHYDNLRLVDYCVEALDFRKHEFRSVVRFTFDYYDPLVSDGPFSVHGACDGLLLMSFRNRLYLSNPTTRQWVSVFPPALKHVKVKAAGLYVHGSEYRVLYYREIGLETTFYISTVGSGNERCIRPHSSLVFVRKLIAAESDAIDFKEPFLFHGNLHWLISLPSCRDILVFDTIGEVFWLLHAPVKNLALMSSLLEIDGMLSISNSNVGGSKVNLWLLQDYKGVVWVHKYRIKLPVLEISRFEEHGGWCSHILSREGDVLVDGYHWQLHFDRNGNLLEKFQCNGRLLNFTVNVFRESLVPHALF